MAAEGDGQAELSRWRQTFLTALSHVARRAMGPLYVAGLIGLGERKRVQPMMAHAEGGSYDRLREFIGAEIWDAASGAGARCRCRSPVGAPDAIMVVDDTTLPKKGGTQSGSRHNTPPRSAKTPPAGRWSRSRWRVVRRPSPWG